MCVRIIDTHAHLDGEEYAQDLAAVIARARQAGISKIFLPAINEALLPHLLTVAEAFPDYLYPMIGLHPEEVKANWQQELQRLHELLAADRQGACRYIIGLGNLRGSSWQLSNSRWHGLLSFICL